nr:actin-binding protein wsp1-like [Lolium perenne]
MRAVTVAITFVDGAAPLRAVLQVCAPPARPSPPSPSRTVAGRRCIATARPWRPPLRATPHTPPDTARRLVVRATRRHPPPLDAAHQVLDGMRRRGRGRLPPSPSTALRRPRAALTLHGRSLTRAPPSRAPPRAALTLHGRASARAAGPCPARASGRCSPRHDADREHGQLQLPRDAPRRCLGPPPSTPPRAVSL